MNIIIVYSGKGGVGKTTISTLLAKKMSEKFKTLLMDADFNTPSVLHLDLQSTKNLSVRSTKFDMVMTKKMVRDLIQEYSGYISENKFEVVIVDTPPSITEVHRALFESIKPSGVLYVTTPSTLSIEDVKKGRSYVESQFGTTSLGCIVNMFTNEDDATEIEKKVDMPVIGVVDLDDQYKDRNIKDTPPPDFLQLDGAAIDPASFITYVNNDVRHLLDDKRTIKDLSVNKPEKSTMNGRYIFVDADDFKGETGKVVGGDYVPGFFVNLKSWDDIRYAIQCRERMGFQRDRFLDENDAQRLEKMVRRFINDTSPFFMLRTPPNVPVKALPFEILPCRLVLNDDKKRWYGVPRLTSIIGGEEVTLFAHEVMTLPSPEITAQLNTGGWELIGENRWFPRLDTYLEMMAHFGGFCRPFEGTEEEYNQIRKTVWEQEGLPQ